MITVDKNRCAKCGKCVQIMQGYCITEKDGYPVFDAGVCNICQKCVSICPCQAIMVNNTYPDKIISHESISSDALFSLFEKRRSIKHFIAKPIPKEIIAKIVSVAKFAPNQNKNISVLVIDDPALIVEIDQSATSFVRAMYRTLFGFRPLTKFFKLFYSQLDMLKRKMEHRKNVVKENTGALIILTGNKKIAVTESSAHYMLANMMYMAESLGIGNCLMDSISLALKVNSKLRKKLNIRENVLGVLTLGYSNEDIVNIPRGYEMNIRWNV